MLGIVIRMVVYASSLMKVLFERVLGIIWGDSIMTSTMYSSLGVSYQVV